MTRITHSAFKNGGPPGNWMGAEEIWNEEDDKALADEPVCPVCFKPWSQCHCGHGCQVCSGKADYVVSLCAQCFEALRNTDEGDVTDDNPDGTRRYDLADGAEPYIVGWHI